MNEYDREEHETYIKQHMNSKPLDALLMDARSVYPNSKIVFDTVYGDGIRFTPQDWDGSIVVPYEMPIPWMGKFNVDGRMWPEKLVDFDGMARQKRREWELRTHGKISKENARRFLV